MPLEYFITEKNKVVVISFVGELTENNIEAINKCNQEVSAKSFTFVVLNFSDAKEIDQSALRPLTLLQQGIRQKPAELRLCGLNSKLKEYLLIRGSLRDTEVMNSLEESLKSMNRKISNPGRKGT